MADTDDNEGFVSRWSRRKKTEVEEKAASAAPPAPNEAASREPDPTPEELAAREQAIVESLPDIDSLDDDSDFSVFLKEGVPEVLRRQALRKLWRVNPLLAGLDGLNDYDEDFTLVNLGVEGLKTAYIVGKGYLSEEDEAPPEALPDSGGEAPDAPLIDEAGDSDKVADGATAESETLAEEDGPGGREAAAAPGVPASQPESDAPPAITRQAAVCRPDGLGAKKSARERRWGKGDA